MDKPSQLDLLAGSNDFDLVLVGDGSGSTLDKPCGWFVTVYDRTTGKVEKLFGGTSGGTNNYAELAPYLQAMWMYHTVTFGQTYLNPAEQRKTVRVLVISDSEVTVKCGNRQYARRANGSLWASLEWFEQRGYVFTWRHVPRNSNAFNTMADQVAGVVRLKMAGILTREDSDVSTEQRAHDGS